MGNRLVINTVNFSTQNPQLKKNKIKQTPSFQGGGATAIVNVMQAIENGGIAASFTIQDFLGLNIPRTIYNLFRNKDVTGELNKEASLETGLREFITGPSMMAIPFGVFAFTKKIFGKASDVEFPLLRRVGEHFESMNHSNTIKQDTQATLNDLYKSVFKNAFDNTYGENKIAEKDIEKIAKEAVDLQNKKAKLAKTSIFNKAERKQIKGEIKKLEEGILNFVAKNNKDVGNISTPYEMKLSSTTHEAKSVNTRKLLKNMNKYSGDVVEATIRKIKSVPENAVKVTTEHIESFIKNTNIKKIGGRTLATSLAVLSIAGFSYFIPKIYSRNKKPPGEAGLKTGENKTKSKNLAAMTIKEKNKIENESKKTNAISFTGAKVNPLLTEKAGKGFINAVGKFMSKARGGFDKILDFEGMSMTHQLLVLTTFGFVNVPRVLHARTKDERREILWRDYATVATICFAFPTLNKLAATAYRKMTGIVCSFNKDRQTQSKGKRFLEHFRLLDINKGDRTLPEEGIRNAYTNIEKHHGGINGFLKYIDEQKGNIQKLLKNDKNLEKPVADMIKEYTKTTGKTFDGSNKAFIEMFKHASEDRKDIFKEGIEKLKNAFHPSEVIDTRKTIFGKTKNIVKHNKFVQKALFGTKIMSAVNIFVVIPGFLGIFLPWLNEQVTKNKYTNPKKVKTPISQNTIQNTSNIHFMNSSNVLNEKQKQIFKDFIKPNKKAKLNG